MYFIFKREAYIFVFTKSNSTLSFSTHQSLSLKSACYPAEEVCQVKGGLHLALIAAICLGGKGFTGQYGDMIIYFLFTLISANIGFRLPNSKSLQVAQTGGKKIKDIYEKTFLPKG